ncbi:MAG: hypothetical protein SOU51_01150 [Collinsella sp.]|nr:hypothetical protein [Collinsella sp.]
MRNAYRPPSVAIRRHIEAAKSINDPMDPVWWHEVASALLVLSRAEAAVDDELVVDLYDQYRSAHERSVGILPPAARTAPQIPESWFDSIESSATLIERAGRALAASRGMPWGQITEPGSNEDADDRTARPSGKEYAMNDQNERTKVYFEKQMVSLSDPRIGAGGKEYRFLNCSLRPGTEIGGRDASWFRLSTIAAPWHEQDIADPARDRIKVELDAGSMVTLKRWDAATSSEEEIACTPTELADAILAQREAFNEQHATLEFASSMVSLSEPRTGKGGKEFRFLECKLFPGTEVAGRDASWYRMSRIATPAQVDAMKSGAPRIKVYIPRTEEVELSRWDGETGRAESFTASAEDISRGIKSQRAAYAAKKKPDSLDASCVGTSALKKSAAQARETSPSGAQQSPSHSIGR